jgi:hypothetical protein
VALQEKKEKKRIGAEAPCGGAEGVGRRRRRRQVTYPAGGICYARGGAAGVLAKLGKAHDAVAGETEKTQTWLDEVEHSMNADSKFVQLHDNVGAIPSSKMF